VSLVHEEHSAVRLAHQILKGLGAVADQSSAVGLDKHLRLSQAKLVQKSAKRSKRKVIERM